MRVLGKIEINQCLILVRQILKTLFTPSILFFIFISTIESQPVSKKLFKYHHNKLMFDSGKDWENLSLIKSQRYNLDFFEYAKFKNFANISLHNQSVNISIIKNFVFKKNFFAFMDFNFSKNLNDNFYFSDSSNRYVSQSGFGYQNDWVLFQLGRGNEDWSAGNNINLALSENSELYDYLLLMSNYGRVRVNYIHGFLGIKNGKVNRYINARGLEWTNKKFLVLGLSEIIVYSGINRSLDIGYVNPISTHLEVELNNRLNVIGDQSSNAVWQIHSDILIKQRSRISINYLFDEFVLDKDIEKGKEHGRGYSVKYSYSVPFSEGYILNFSIFKVLIGTPTFRHRNGTNNFIAKNKPLGWEHGSDGTENGFGLSFSNENKYLFNIKMGTVKSGEESISSRPFDTYKDYLFGDFPSGNILHSNYFSVKLFWLLFPRVEIRGELNYLEEFKHNIKLDTSLSFNYYF